MTREEAIEKLNNAKGCPLLYDSHIEAIDMAISALEQEPCDDAISRKDAEQMFRNIRSHLKPQDYKSAEEFNTRDLMLLNAEQMIHALPSVTQKSGKWIPVSERLPEERHAVLVWCPERKNIYCACLEAGKWWIFGGYFEKVKLEVIAWMSLPEPYEPQESEEISDKNMKMWEEIFKAERSGK